MANVERDNTEMVEVQKIWQSIVEESLKDRGKENKRIGILCWIMAAVIIIMAVSGLYFYDKQQDKFMVQIESMAAKNEKQQKDFLDFLNQYELAEYSQDVSDGGDANFIGRDGDITGGEPKDKNTSEAER